MPCAKIYSRVQKYLANQNLLKLYVFAKIIYYTEKTVLSKNLIF